MRSLLLRRMSPVMARTGPPAMSAVLSLSGGKRTWRLRAPTSEFDPDPDIGNGEILHRKLLV
jgi:hypothetical protein